MTSNEGSELLDLAYLYAIDALDDTERREIEDRLAQSEAQVRDDFEAIVRDTREAMSAVSSTTATEPPPSVRTSILAAIEPQPVAPEKRWTRRVLVAAAAVVALGAGSAAIVQYQRPPEDSVVVSVQAAADRRDLRVDLSTGGTMTVTYSQKLGQAFVALDRVANAPAGRTYELWILRSGAHPAGFARPGTPTALSGLDPGVAVAVTIEQAGGAQQPTMTPLAVATLQ